MRYIIILSLFACFCFPQFEGGKKSIGGGVEFYRSSVKFTLSDEDVEVLETSTAIKPKGEYFVSDKISIGGEISYTMLTNIITIEGDEIYNSGDDPDFENPMGFGFFGRYFMGTTYGHIGYYEPDNTSDGDEYLGIGAGYLMPLTDTIFIDSNFTYRHLVNVKDHAITTASEYGNTDTDLDTPSGMQIYGSIGITVIF